MSRREQNINRKLQLQKSQLRSILSDFRKAKHKCIALCQQLQTQFQNKNQFQAIQKQIIIKSDLLDVVGLVALKNKLVKYSALSELFDFQSQLNTKKQRIAAKKQFQKLMTSTKNTTVKPPKNFSMHQIKFKTAQQDSNSKPAGEPGQQNYAKTSIFNVPLYHITEDTTENKVERISKFIASLKSKQSNQIGNMKLQTQQNPIEKIKQLLHQDPEYLQMKQQLEKVKKQKQELQGRIKSIKQQAVENYIKAAQVVQQTEYYKVIKIYKSQKQINQSRQSSTAVTTTNILGPQQLNPSNPQPITSLGKIQNINSSPENQRNSPSIRRLRIKNFQQQLESLRSKRKDVQILQIQRELETQQYNVSAVVSRISTTLQNNQQRLRKLRQKRLKIFERQQEVWNQLQQM